MTRSSFSGNLNKHRRIHSGENPCACPDCDKKFKDSGQINNHRRSHTGEKPFACPDCDKKFIHRGQIIIIIIIINFYSPVSNTRCHSIGHKMRIARIKIRVDSPGRWERA